MVGANPVAVLQKYPGRVRTIHIKAHGGGPDVVIDEDKVDWAAAFEFCETKGGTKWYVLEHESSKDPLEAVRRQAQFRCSEEVRRSVAGPYPRPGVFLLCCDVDESSQPRLDMGLPLTGPGSIFIACLHNELAVQ